MVQVSSPAHSMRRVVALGAAAALSIAALVIAAPAASAATTQTATCVDGGGVRWNSKAVWGAVYAGTGGVATVTMESAGWTTTKAGTVKTDSSVKTYNGSGTLIQTLTWTGAFAYGSGTTYKSRNPLNPPSSPGKSKYPDGTAVTAGWMGSTGHRANILNARYRLIGVGASQDSDGRWYAAQVFGSTS